MIERKALIFNTQKYNMYDGPGVRTIVFFKGCPLRCQWCSNPEGQKRGFEVFYKVDLCVNCGTCAEVCPSGVHGFSSDGKHKIERGAQCVGCRKCETACPRAALGISGQMHSISNLMAIIEEDMPFYETSGGGFTLGGGEALAQPEAAANLLMACKQKGINTAMETCGYAKPEALLKAAEFTDLFLFDLKHMDSERHRALTGVRNESILKNMRLLLENRYQVKARLPLLTGMNDDEAALRQIVDFLRPWQDRKNFKGVDLLPYHKLGVHKYSLLGMEYPLKGEYGFSDNDLEKIRLFFERNGLEVSVVKH